MITVDMPQSLAEVMEAIHATSGATASLMLSMALEFFDEHASLEKVGGDRVPVRFYVTTLEKRKLEKVSRHLKTSISEVVRTALARKLGGTAQ